MTQYEILIYKVFLVIYRKSIILLKKLKKILVNNQIRAEKIRLVDEAGNNMGVFDLTEAQRIAQEKGLDLILITDKTNPPICKLTEYGKYLYSLKKKEKKKKTEGELKNIRLGFNISEHDIETKINSIVKFLERGDKARIELKLIGRQKKFTEMGKEKIQRIIDELNKRLPIKIERDLKEEQGKITIIVSKK
jgi:translation initiation factor IF-3